MPERGDRQRVQHLTAQDAQVVEVLPADEYQWAHLPGAINLPLKQLPQRLDELNSNAPVVVYDYVAGKSDWLAHDLPFEGDAQADELLHRLHAADVSRVVVTRPDGTLVGMVFAEDLAHREEPPG